jgi:hypothetical protein
LFTRAGVVGGVVLAVVDVSVIVESTAITGIDDLIAVSVSISGWNKVLKGIALSFIASCGELLASVAGNDCTRAKFTCTGVELLCIDTGIELDDIHKSGTVAVLVLRITLCIRTQCEERLR